MYNNITLHDISYGIIQYLYYKILYVPRAVTEVQMQAVADYGVFDVVSRTLRVGSDICRDFLEDPPGGDHSDPNSINDYCYYGGQLDPDKGDCAYPSDFAGARRFCPCSQFGKAMAE